MRFHLPWPGSLGGRTILIVLAAVVLVHLASMIAFRETAADAASAAEAAQIAGRLATARLAISARVPGERAQAAQDLSSGGLTLHWSVRASVDPAGGHVAGLDELRNRLSELMPGVSRDGIHLREGSEQMPGDATAVSGSLILPDASYVDFSLTLPVDVGHGLHAALLSTTLMAGGILLVAILLVRTLVAPLQRLARAADAIGRGPQVIVAEGGPDEVRHVSRAFNEMQARINRLISDRTQALAAVSHDLRTPITRLRLRVGFLADEEAQAPIDADLDEMEAMIDSTLAYLRGDIEPETPKPTDLAAMLATLVDAAVDAGRNAAFDGPWHAYLPLRDLAVKRAFANLIDNALTYGGVARVSLQDLGAAVHVTVADNGPGIPESEIERMFEPFQRLDPSRNSRTGGVGLGLAIVCQAIEREGGTVRLRNSIGGGLRAEVVIPRRGEPARILLTQSAVCRSKPSDNDGSGLSQFETLRSYGRNAGPSEGSR